MGVNTYPVGTPCKSIRTINIMVPNILTSLVLTAPNDCPAEFEDQSQDKPRPQLTLRTYQTAHIDCTSQGL